MKTLFFFLLIAEVDCGQDNGMQFSSGKNHLPVDSSTPAKYPISDTQVTTSNIMCIAVVKA